MSRAPHIIDLGSQPMATPTHTLIELLRRDGLLLESLRRQGLELNIHPFAKGEDINAFFRTGELEMGVTGDIPTLEAAAEFEVIIPAFAKQNFTSMLCRENLPLENLKGKRIAYAPNSTAHYTLFIALETAGLTEKDITTVLMPVNHMPQALAQGEIDAFTAWEPTPAIAQARYPQFITLFRHINSSFLYISRRWADAHPHAAADIVAAAVRAMNWLKSDRENLLKAARWSIQAYETVQPLHNTLSVDKMAELIEEGLLQLAAAPVIPARLLQIHGPLHMQYLFLQHTGKIRRDCPWKKIAAAFDRDLMTAITQNPLQYKTLQYQYHIGDTY